MEWGLVEGFNRRRGMLAVRCVEEGGYAIFEIAQMSANVSVGDRLEWAGRENGRLLISNASRGGTFHVEVQNWDCSESVAKLQIS